MFSSHPTPSDRTGSSATRLRGKTMKGYDYGGKRYVCMVRASHASDELSTDAQMSMLHEGVRDKGMVFVDAIVLDGVTGSLPAKREDLQTLLDRKKTVNDFD